MGKARSADGGCGGSAAWRLGGLGRQTPLVSPSPSGLSALLSTLHAAALVGVVPVSLPASPGSLCAAARRCLLGCRLVRGGGGSGAPFPDPAGVGWGARWGQPVASAGGGGGRCGGANRCGWVRAIWAPAAAASDGWSWWSGARRCWPGARRAAWLGRPGPALSRSGVLGRSVGKDSAPADEVHAWRCLRPVAWWRLAAGCMAVRGWEMEVAAGGGAWWGAHGAQCILWLQTQVMC